jgi:hypothetical protein
MMQLSEYFVWKEQDRKRELKTGSQAALIFNVTQPLVVFLCLIFISNVKLSFKMVASITILFYISFMIKNLNEEKEYKALKPSPKCKHMSLQWWSDIKYSGVLYCITLIMIILLLLRPVSLSLFWSFYLIITLVISIMFYGCGQASMWCWLVVPFPIFLGIFYSQYIK